MRIGSARLTLISSVAIIGAMLWGAVELLALQWSRLSDRPHRQGRIRPA